MFLGKGPESARHVQPDLGGRAAVVVGNWTRAEGQIWRSLDMPTPFI